MDIGDGLFARVPFLAACCGLAGGTGGFWFPEDSESESEEGFPEESVNAGEPATAAESPGDAVETALVASGKDAGGVADMTNETTTPGGRSGASATEQSGAERSIATETDSRWSWWRVLAGWTTRWGPLFAIRKLLVCKNG